MTTDVPRPTPFNPTWITAVAVIVTGLVSGSVSTALNSQGIMDLRRGLEAHDARITALERRSQENELAVGKTLVALSKDVETANKTLTAIQQALLVRGAATLSSNTP